MPVNPAVSSPTRIQALKMLRAAAPRTPLWSGLVVLVVRTVVTIELFETRGGTRLELTQERFETEDSRNQHGHGWAGCLDCLEEALATGAIA